MSDACRRCPTREKDMMGGWSTDSQGSVVGTEYYTRKSAACLVVPAAILAGWSLEYSKLHRLGRDEVVVPEKHTEWKSMLFPHLEEAKTVIAGRKIQLLKDRQALLGKRKRSHHGPHLVTETLVTDAWDCLQWHDKAVSIFLKNLPFKMHEYGQQFCAYHGYEAVQQIWADPVYQDYAHQVHAAHKNSEAWFREATRPAIDREQETEQRYMAQAQLTLDLKSEMADLKQQLQQQPQQQMGTANILDKAAASCDMGPEMSTPAEGVGLAPGTPAVSGNKS